MPETERTLKYPGRIILALGFILYTINVEIDPWKIKMMVFILNIALSCQQLLRNGEGNPPGIDYTAYVNQAGQFAMGQTDYSRISSLQGPCFYPAGHLWLYLPVYYLHLYTDQAVLIMRLVHILVHSLTLLFVTNISYKYYKESPIRAQLIAFLLVSNMRQRYLYSLMFNDQFLEICLISTIYFVASNAPLMAATTLTMGLSIKASGMLMIPTFLGGVMYNYGTVKLTIALTIILIG